jgi:hypothetical protein
MHGDSDNLLVLELTVGNLKSASHPLREALRLRWVIMTSLTVMAVFSNAFARRSSIPSGGEHWSSDRSRSVRRGGV